MVSLVLDPDVNLSLVFERLIYEELCKRLKFAERINICQPLKEGTNPKLRRRFLLGIHHCSTKPTTHLRYNLFLSNVWTVVSCSEQCQLYKDAILIDDSWYDLWFEIHIIFIYKLLIWDEPFKMLLDIFHFSCLGLTALCKRHFIHDFFIMSRHLYLSIYPSSNE